MSYIILFSSNFKRAGQYMIRCVVCRCSRLDSEGYKCALCGGAPGLRTEPCHVTVSYLGPQHVRNLLRLI